jgi:toxin ParE1/3/4
VTSAKSEWAVELTDAANADFLEIVSWTAERFGERQAAVYQRTIVDAVAALRAGPDIHDVKVRPDLGSNMMTMHVARHGHRGRHLLVLRAGPAPLTIVVLRILHDAIDLSRHIVPDDDDWDL